MTTNISDLERKTKHSFVDKNLLDKALTHPSWDSNNNNQFLEYLGDSLLDFLVAEYLYKNNPTMDEGEATKIRARIVSRWPLAKLFDLFSLDTIIKVQNLNKKALSVKLKSDFVEAIIGAIYIDGGIDSARDFVVDFLCSDRTLAASPDYKSKLYEYSAKNNVKLSYSCVSTGAQHKQHFTATAYIDGVEFGRGEGNTKREAEQYASKKALEKLNNVHS